jgi:hypothetical protein
MTDPQSTGARFGRVPARWLDHPGIGIDELAVLTALAIHAGRDGVCCVRQNVLADKLKRRREWVNRIIARLANLDGVLEKERRADRDGWTVSCRYRLPDLAMRELDTPDVIASAYPEQTLDNKNLPSLARAQREPDRRTAQGGEEQGSTTGTGTMLTLPPADWQPSAVDRTWLAEHRPDLDAAAMTAVFVAGCQARNLRYADLSAAWRLWASRQWPSRAKQRSPVPLGVSRPDPASRTAADEDIASRIVARMTARRAGLSLEA